MNRPATLERATRREVLLLGNYRPALAVARALHADGYRIVIGIHGDEGGCEASNRVAEVWDHPRVEDGADDFLTALDAFLVSRAAVSVVFPVAEEYVNALAEHGWKPPEAVTLVGPDAEIVRLFSDKTTALPLARRLGVPTLPFALVQESDDLHAVADDVGYPLIIRPLGATARLGHKKALVLSSAAELSRDLPSWPVDHMRLLLQRCARGRRHNIYFAARDGNLVGLCESRIATTNHPDGTGLAVEGVTVTPSDNLVADTAAFASEVGYTGIGLAQFIVDPLTGERCFIELNPRVSGSHAVPESAGLPLTTMALELARDETAHRYTDVTIGRAGMRYVWTTGALVGAKLAYIRGEIGPGQALTWAAASLRAACTADAHLVWAQDDPWPAIGSLGGVLPKFTRLRAAISRLFPRRADAGTITKEAT